MKLSNLFVFIMVFCGLVLAAPLKVVAVESGPAGYDSQSLSGVTVYLKHPYTGETLDSATTTDDGVTFDVELDSPFYITTAENYALGGMYGFFQEVAGEGVPVFEISQYEEQYYSLCRLSNNECSYSSTPMLILYQISEDVEVDEVDIDDNGGYVPNWPLDTTPVYFEVSVNNYPDTNDVYNSESINGWVNVYTIISIEQGNYQGVLKETKESTVGDPAQFTVNYGEIVDFVGFKSYENAVAADEGTFTAPPYKHFGKSDALCQINYDDEDTVMIMGNYGEPSCAISLGTPYQDSYTVEYDCVDFDYGLDIYTYSSAKERVWTNGDLSEEFEYDSCYDSNTVKEMVCVNDYGNLAGEFGESLSYELEDCPSGYSCSYGACIADEVSDDCYDSDGGAYYYSKGTVSKEDWPTSTDHCSYGQLAEYYCDASTGDPSVTYVDCPSGYYCSYGECVEDYYGSNTYYGDGYYTLSAGDKVVLSSGYELELVEYLMVGNDNDGIGRKPSLSFYLDTGYGDFKWTPDLRIDDERECYHSDDNYPNACVTLYELYTDTTPSDNLNEYDGDFSTYVYVDSGDYSYYDDYYCYDSDAGNNKYAKGTTTKYNYDGEVVYSYTDYCYEENVVAEYACDEDYIDVSYESCPSGYSCSNGACVFDYEEYYCSETDSGYDLYADGTTTVYYSDGAVHSSGTDYCYSSDQLKEYYCSGDSLSSAFVYCPSGYSCSNGACIVDEVEVEEYTVVLKKGWNLLSSPVGFDSTKTAKVTYTNCESENYFVYNSDKKEYDIFDLKLGGVVPSQNGFWLYSDSSCKITFTGESKDSYDDPLTVPKGWVAIAGPYNSVDWEDVVGNCVIKSGPWEFDTSAWTWKKATKLKPGKGYFVKTSSSCTLGKGYMPPAPPEE